jgi:DNA-3-methyladenine glycosylase
MAYSKLSAEFYRREDVVDVARELLGKVLCSRMDGELTSGIITETEAYCGRNDRACHANDGLRTARTETMYRPGGVAYVYLCYGIHHLFNVVTNVEDRADAVLIRAVEPADGTAFMLQRRGRDKVSPALTAGPGRLTQALGITTSFDGTDLTGDVIWIEDRGLVIPNDALTASPRIGVDYAGDHALREWRFYVAGSRWVS